MDKERNSLSGLKNLYIEKRLPIAIIVYLVAFPLALFVVSDLVLLFTIWGAALVHLLICAFLDAFYG